jgi:hypothetical protein
MKLDRSTFWVGEYHKAATVIEIERDLFLDRTPPIARRPNLDCDIRRDARSFARIFGLIAGHALE